jgi:hypothetical protein
LESGLYLLDSVNEGSFEPFEFDLQLGSKGVSAPLSVLPLLRSLNQLLTRPQKFCVHTKPDNQRVLHLRYRLHRLPAVRGDQLFLKLIPVIRTGSSDPIMISHAQLFPFLSPQAMTRLF